MAVGLSKSVGGSGAQPPSGGPDLDGFRGLIPGRVFDAYCEGSTWRSLVDEGVGSFGLDRKVSRHRELPLQKDGSVLKRTDGRQEDAEHPRDPVE